MEGLTELLNYGVLGIMTVLLLYGVKVLYKRNCEHSDKLIDIVQKNNDVIATHTEAINGLRSVIDKCKR